MRRALNRRKTARKFNRRSARTKAINITPPFTRGGRRL